MKNSTLLIILFIASIFGVLSYLYPIVMFQILIMGLSILLLSYLIVCLVEYSDGMYGAIEPKYNIFRIIFGSVSNFFKWLDSKPNLIKPSKKNWRAPEDWQDEI